MAALSKDELLNNIIIPVLSTLQLDCESACNLLLGTCAQESHMGYWRKQMEGGPALGIYQMEEATYNSIFNDFLAYRSDLKQKVLSFCNGSPNFSQLEDNDQYATALARIKYFWAPEPLPPYNDIRKLAEYWKKYYNTPLGKGKISDFIANYMEYIG